MKAKKAALLQIILSVLFAVATILTSIFLKGSEHANTATYIIIAVWWIPFSLLVVAGAKGEK